MPRQTQSKASAIVNYFRTTELEVADTVLGLAQDAVRERQTRSKNAKERAVRSNVAAALDRPRADTSLRKARTKKKKVVKKKVSLPAATSVTVDEFGKV